MQSDSYTCLLRFATACKVVSNAVSDLTGQNLTSCTGDVRVYHLTGLFVVYICTGRLFVMYVVFFTDTLFKRL